MPVPNPPDYHLVYQSRSPVVLCCIVKSMPGLEEVKREGIGDSCFRARIIRLQTLLWIFFPGGLITCFENRIICRILPNEEFKMPGRVFLQEKKSAGWSLGQGKMWNRLNIGCARNHILNCFVRLKVYRHRETLSKLKSIGREVPGLLTLRTGASIPPRPYIQYTNTGATLSFT